MASLRTLFISLLAALTLAAAPTASAIVNGQDDKGHSYVVFVGQQVVVPGGTVNTQACSGTLVGPKTVLTAAHCSIAPGPVPLCSDSVTVFCLRWVVRQGQNLRTPDTETTAKSFDVFPGFCGTCSPFSTTDLGVITLVDPLSGPYAKLPKADSVEKKFSRTHKATIVGFGVDAPGAPATSLGPRRKASVEAKLFAPVPSLLELPVPSRSKYGIACSGDSGGPVLKGKSILAVISFGDLACGGPTYAVRLDTAAARSFIANYVDLKGHEANDDDERDGDNDD